MNTDFFKAKNALIIGGTGGIGRAISLALFDAGANIIAQGGHSSLKNREVQTEQKFSSITLDFTKINLAQFDAPAMPDASTNQARALNALKAALKKCDILCICYGPFLQKPLAKTTAAEWLSTTTQNLALPGILAGRAAPFMKKRGFGRILFFGGTRTAQINGFRTNAAYAATKTGIASLTKSFALEFGAFGITANAIFPGFVKTEYVSRKQQSAYEKILGGKMISTETIAKNALSLLSSLDFNGTLLEIDRGLN